MRRLCGVLVCGVCWVLERLTCEVGCGLVEEGNPAVESAVGHFASFLGLVLCHNGWFPAPDACVCDILSDWDLNCHTLRVRLQIDIHCEPQRRASLAVSQMRLALAPRFVFSPRPLLLKSPSAPAPARVSSRTLLLPNLHRTHSIDLRNPPLKVHPNQLPLP